MGIWLLLTPNAPIAFAISFVLYGVFFGWVLFRLETNPMYILKDSKLEIFNALKGYVEVDLNEIERYEEIHGHFTMFIGKKAHMVTSTMIGKQKFSKLRNSMLEVLKN